MIVEQRTYTLRPGTIGEFLKLYEAEGFPIQHRVLGRLVGYYTSEIGALNQVIHMWGYDTFEERTEKRAALLRVPEWRTYATKARPFFVTQENRILLPAPFSLGKAVSP